MLIGEQLIEYLNLEYQKKIPLYDAFTKSVAAVCTSLLKAKDIDFLTLEPRTKTIESFKGKISRPDKQDKYFKISDITDLSGIRIVAHYEKDVEQISNIIKENFLIDEGNSVDKINQLPPDRFGYLSNHFIASYSKQRVDLVENKQFSDLKVEIQVRTVVQHAWAVIDRHLRYNNEDDIPFELRRKLFRVSALLELADKEFSAIDLSITQLRKSYESDVKTGNLDIKINRDSIDIFLKESTNVALVVKAAEKSGINIANSPENPDSGKILLNLAQVLGLESIGDIDNAIISSIGESEKLFKLFSEVRENTRQIWHMPSLVVALLIAMTTTEQNVQKVLQGVTFSKQAANAISTVYDLKKLNSKK